MPTTTIPRPSGWGGRDIALRDLIGAGLRDAGLPAIANQQLPGMAAGNICNRTATGRGVQLELPLTLRRRLVASVELLATFVAAVRTASVEP